MDVYSLAASGRIIYQGLPVNLSQGHFKNQTTRRGPLGKGHLEGPWRWTGTADFCGGCGKGEDFSLEVQKRAF